MKDKFLCAMAQYDEKMEKELGRIQKVLLDEGFIGKQTSNLPNHITLGSFETNSEGDLKERLITICKNTERIKISLNSIDCLGWMFFLLLLVSHMNKYIRI